MTTDVLTRYLEIRAESPEQSVLRLLVELAAQVTGAREGSLLILDRSQDPPRELVFAMTIGSEESERTLVGQRVPLGEGLTGIAAVTHEVQVGAPIYEGVRYAEGGDAPEVQPSAVIAAPMLIDDRLVGVITAVHFEPGRRFGTEDAALYARAAAVAGVVVDQAQRLETQAPGGGREPTTSDPARTQLEGEIRASVERILASGSERLREVLPMLRSLESLVGSRPS